jgi:hypothetical protein
MRLRLSATGRSPSTVRVRLDDAEITSSLVSIGIEFAVDEMNRATLTISPDELEVDAEVIALLEAHLKKEPV